MHGFRKEILGGVEVSQCFHAVQKLYLEGSMKDDCADQHDVIEEVIVFSLSIGLETRSKAHRDRARRLRRKKC